MNLPVEESDDSETDVFVVRERFDEMGKKMKTDACSEMGRRQLLLGPPGTLNTITPCAAYLLGLQEVPESQRADAANSLVYEANLRLRDPVYGCMGAIVTLQQQMQTLQAELNAVRAEILKYKFREITTTTTSNIIIPSSHTHAALISVGGAVSSIAAPSSPLPPTPPPAPPRPPPSIVVSSSSSSSTSNSLYTSSTTATGYSSISSDNVPYFD
ncbi:hypothetical protein V6N11_009329 [Hibiscus sabdariffa]|uniref:LOB domain-containing protein n=1 Tax=Hibiscus sabdariffa TaxID=183260 RepID=A0ABR2PQC5_9ROSI